jgi:hypothetical protein
MPEIILRDIQPMDATLYRFLSYTYTDAVSLRTHARR